MKSYVKIHGAILLTLIVQNTTARNFFPQIDRLRNKIETINKNSPQTNIKELLENAHIEYDPNGTMHKIISSDQGQNSNTQSLEQELKQLYWSNRTDLVDLMNTKELLPKYEQWAIIKKELNIKYPNNNRAIITFTGDLASEDAKLQDLVNKIFKKISTEKDASTKQKLNELLNWTTKLKTNLQILATTINKILTEAKYY